MIAYFLRKIFGSQNERELRRLVPIVQRINELEASIKLLSDEALSRKTAEFKTRHEQGESLDELLPEAFATVREASFRVLGMRHFDVQLIGGTILHEGKIAEMKTGEGKTLTATLPVYLNALTGKGVHLVTVNDYLARRDAEWMGRIYGFLGLSTGCILHNLTNEERAAAYGSDITYGQNNEFGFDYLRDNMKLELADMVQRGHQFAIVDEVDSILIDESRTPLIISGPTENATETYQVADQVVRKLRAEEHYTIELKTKQVALTEAGVHEVERILNLENMYDPSNIEIVHHMNQALKAHTTMKLDVDYVVRDGQVLIVDEFTGRLMPGRRWSDGLHQAVEAKEGVKIARENQTLATITFQNYFRMYKKLAGMTGTADTEAVEFKKIYNLDVVAIPTNKRMVRTDYADVIYGTERGKFAAVVKELDECVKRGQPVLVGTASIEKSEMLSGLLSKKGIPHHVLNAKQHEREAEIVAQAGRLGMVTISTNMAGRGTDILLGGNPEFLAAASAQTKEADDPDYQEELEHFTQVCAEEKRQVIEAGGLHILGTERHESRRIDNQLRGRSGRQGDPGSSRFYVSLEDDLMRRFGGDRIQAFIGLRDEDAVAGKLVGRAIENAQKKVEGYHFDIRKHLLEYDDVMNKQRQVIYGLRDTILRGEDVEERILEAIPDLIEATIMSRASDKTPVHEWDVKGMFEDFARLFGFALPYERFLAEQERGDTKLAQEVFEYLHECAKRRYDERLGRVGRERMLRVARQVLLQTTDYFWKEHLANMDHLKEGIGLRGYGQKNPLYEYQREAFEMFERMLIAVNGAVIQQLFIPELPSEEEVAELERREKEALKKVEEQAKTIHEDVLEPTEEEAAQTAGLNRQQRRAEAAKHRAPQYTPSSEDYLPTANTLSAAERVRKEQARKKAKAARKDRKRSR